MGMQAAPSPRHGRELLIEASISQAQVGSALLLTASCATS
jgi:hypothetical protein